MSTSDQYDSGFNLRISGNGIEINRAVDEVVVAQIINILLSPAPAPGVSKTPGTGTLSTATTQATTQSTAPHTPSLGEFLDQVNAKKITQRILAMAYYLTRVINQIPNQTFSKSDIRPCFRLAHEPEPANFPRDFNTVIGLGWFARDGNTLDRFFITRAGHAAVEQQFGKSVRRIFRHRRVEAEVNDEQEDSSQSSDHE